MDCFWSRGVAARMEVSRLNDECYLSTGKDGRDLKSLKAVLSLLTMLQGVIPEPSFVQKLLSSPLQSDGDPCLLAVGTTRSHRGEGGNAE